MNCLNVNALERFVRQSMYKKCWFLISSELEKNEKNSLQVLTVFAMFKQFEPLLLNFVASLTDYI